mgnify:CR=1 FL=1
MKLDLKFQLTNLDGSSTVGLNAGQFLADRLSLKTKHFSAGKACILAYSMYKDGIIEIDAEDLKLLEQEVSERDSPVYQNLSNLFANQILKAIEKSREESKKKVN